MFESWRGRYGDHPRRVSEVLGQMRPDLERVWSSDGSADLPSDIHGVRRHSPAYFARLASARALVTNDIVSRQMVKGPRVTYVQTWHGTPLKLIGKDERSLTYPGARRHLRRMTRDVGHWDALVSPAPEVTTILRGAFGYSGPVWETGYPRNDVLASADAPMIRTRTRGLLGAAADALVVLHLPTWRDEEALGRGRVTHSVHLDPEKLAPRVPEGTVLVSRMHRNVVEAGTRLGHPMVVDGNRFDVADLYLAADVLVSDYSSAVYDFAVTGRPIVLYAPDLDAYRDRVRGLYFDYYEWAPGPVVASVEDLAAHLSDLAAVRRAFGARYQTFRERFCPWEDGQAGVRVAHRLLDTSRL